MEKYTIEFEKDVNDEEIMILRSPKGSAVKVELDPKLFTVFKNAMKGLLECDTRYSLPLTSFSYYNTVLYKWEQTYV